MLRLAFTAESQKGVAVRSGGICIDSIVCATLPHVALVGPGYRQPSCKLYHHLPVFLPLGKTGARSWLESCEQQSWLGVTVEAPALGSRLPARVKDFCGIQMLPPVAEKLVQWFSLMYIKDFFFP